MPMNEVGSQKPPSTTRQSSTARTAFKLVATILGSALVGFLLVAVSSDWSVLVSEALAARAEAGSAASEATLNALPLLETGVIVSAFAIGVVGVSTVIFGLRPWSFITLAARFQWGMFAAGFGFVLVIQVCALIATVGISAPTNPFAQIHNWHYAFIFSAIALLFIIPAVLAEEIIFRGWLNQIKCPVHLQLIVVMASAIVFSFAHLQWDYLTFAMRFVAGLAYGWAVIRLGGLELALGAHLAKNVSLVWLLGLPGEHQWEGRDYEISVAMVFATSIALLALVEMLARRGQRPDLGHSELR